MKKLPRVGDRVIVDRGGHEVEGEVFYVSRTPPMVGVEIWFEGADEPSLSTYRPEWVRPAEPATR